MLVLAGVEEVEVKEVVGEKNETKATRETREEGTVSAAWISKSSRTESRTESRTG